MLGKQQWFYDWQAIEVSIGVWVFLKGDRGVRKCAVVPPILYSVVEFLLSERNLRVDVVGTCKVAFSL